VIDGNPIVVLLQSTSGVSAITPEIDLFLLSSVCRLVWCPGQNKRVAPLSFLHRYHNIDIFDCKLHGYIAFVKSVKEKT
jgi:hypothetical protein